MPKIIPIIHAERLDLHLMTPVFLAAALGDDQAQAAMQLLGAIIPAEWWQERDLMARRLTQVRHDPTYHPWLPRAIVLRQQQIMIGHINFHTAPDPEYLRALAPAALNLAIPSFPNGNGRVMPLKPVKHS